MKRITTGHGVLAVLLGILAWQVVANYSKDNEIPEKATPDTARAMTPPRPPAPVAFPYREVATFTDLGRTWHVIAVPKPLSDADLTSLAVSLHAAHPNDSYEVFDSDPGIKAYVKWSEHHPPIAPYPERWMRLHHLAMINRMLDGWQLLGGAAHPTLPESVIAVL